jgi:aspartyl-tRNA(Asn)/glutamyl-tRNA(Gln) amidotransferase subunit B
LPAAKKSRFLSQYGLNEQDALALVQEREVAAYFEQVESIAPGDPKQIANWITGEVFGALNRAGLAFAQLPVPSVGLAALLGRIRDKTISGSMAKQVFEEMWETGDTPDAIIERRGFKQLTDDGAIAALVDEVIAASPEQVEQYRSGKDKVFGFFVGQVMKKSKGQANPQQLNEILKAKLGR